MTGKNEVETKLFMVKFCWIWPNKMRSTQNCLWLSYLFVELWTDVYPFRIAPILTILPDSESSRRDLSFETHFEFFVFPHPLCWGCKILVLSRPPVRVSPSLPTQEIVRPPLPPSSPRRLLYAPAQFSVPALPAQVGSQKLVRKSWFAKVGSQKFSAWNNEASLSIHASSILCAGPPLFLCGP